MKHHYSTTSTTSTSTTKVITNQNKKSLSWGINDYPGSNNDLQGCVNDAKDWFDLLTKTYGFSGEILLDSQATKNQIVKRMGDMIADAKAGDVLVWTGSSHGTSVYDGNSDEAEGKDEAICLYNGLLLDDDIREMITNMNPEVSLTVISDSCFSGSVTRDFLSTTGDTSRYIKPRYLPPNDVVDSYLVINAPKRKKIFYTEDNMKEILLSGCSDNQYSYDTFLGGQNRGAMSYFATKIIRENPAQTYAQFYEKLRKVLPSSSYSQTPCLEGSLINKNKPLFT